MLVCYWEHRDLGLSQIVLAEKFGILQTAVSELLGRTSARVCNEKRSRQKLSNMKAKNDVIDRGSRILRLKLSTGMPSCTMPRCNRLGCTHFVPSDKKPDGYDLIGTL